MPRNKHKRKAVSHAKPKSLKRLKSKGVMASHPKVFVLLGLLFVALGVSLLVFKSQYNAMFGFAMLSIIVGSVTAIFASFSVPKKKTD